MEELNLAGKTAIITGGGTGIGREAAITLSQIGVNVTIVGRRLSPLEETAERIHQAGANALVFQGDVSKEADVKHLVGFCVTEFDTVDILINNAGINGSGPIHIHDVKTWDEVMAINLKGPFLLARYVLPLMRGQRDGHIINISSESGLEYYEGNGAYGVSKHALNALGEYIQRENQEYGVRVDTICPGMVVTPMSDRAKGLNREKCLFPEDISDLILWLLKKRQNVKIGWPILIQTMENPWE
jgi:NAD(P)-dependent dehydrogenase (short-subunit alcohol dehydrogenase family)